MIILKRYKDSEERLKSEGLPIGWFETTEEECLSHTEGCGWWKEGTVLDMLKDGALVWNPLAEFKMKEEAAERIQEKRIEEKLEEIQGICYKGS